MKAPQPPSYEKQVALSRTIPYSPFAKFCFALKGIMFYNKKGQRVYKYQIFAAGYTDVKALISFKTPYTLKHKTLIDYKTDYDPSYLPPPNPNSYRTTAPI